MRMEGLHAFTVDPRPDSGATGDCVETDRPRRAAQQARYRLAGVPVATASAVRLPGRAGELRIGWRVPARTSSFDGVTAALQKAYRQRGATPPR